ncbi:MULTISPECIES: FtsX-like permease family protein [Mumia]|uniref:FtsX-like permease family protein n=1 Tax=Mumia TaxID=1546255 RepID=UPI001421E1B7|nr:FtsX-like permease family protein [Mumia sp. ZJ1417]QMW65427.1 FtsX-like permease family protein [Mumia sp. ZJ1417]
MLSLSRQVVRSSWTLYVGAFVALALGVALIGLATELTAAAGTAYDALGAGEDAAREQLDGLLSMLGFMAGISGFMAIFVVASTFSFVVSARRRELALLRLVGATPRQVRRMIRAEALVVALFAACAGVVVGHLLTGPTLWFLAQRGLAPEGMSTPSPWWAVSIALPTGVLVALLGARAAARRASRVPAVDALRESAVERRRIGFWRAVTGVACVAGSVAMLVGTGTLDSELVILFAIFAPQLIVIALVCFGQLVIPPVARLVGRLGPRGDVALRLARDNVSAQSRRTASLAAPILAISAIAGSLLLTMSFSVDWVRALTTERLQAPVVVQTDGNPDAMDALERSRVVGTLDAGVPVVVKARMHGETVRETAEGIDPSAAAAARGTRARTGSLDDLSGQTVALSQQYARDYGQRVGDRVAFTFPDGTTARLTTVAVVDDAPELQADVLVPRALALRHAPEGVPEHAFVLPASGVPASETLRVLDTELAASGADVSTAGSWIDQRDAEQRHMNQIAILVLLGPAGVYSAIAIANTLLMGSLQRRHEFVTTRLIGATTRQVRRMVLWESALVSAAALLLGALTMAGIGALMHASLSERLPDMAATVPWGSLLVIGAACAVTAIGAALAPTRFMLRRTSPSEATVE